MAMLHNELLDDPLLTDGCVQFTGGQNESVAPYLLTENQYEYALNMDYRSNGLLETRFGSEDFGGGLGSKVHGVLFYSTPSMERVLALCEGTAWAYDGTGWNVLSGYAPSTSHGVSMVQGVQKVYMADGQSNMHYWEGTACVDMGTGGSNPPRGNVLCWHTNRLFMAGISSEPDAIYVSDLLDGGTWDAVNQQLRVGAGDGEKIVALASWDNFNLVVLKERSVYVVNANPQVSVGEWAIERVHDRIGCVARGSVAMVGRDVWWLSAQGVVSLRRLSDQALREIQVDISQPLMKQWGLVNRSQWHKANAIFFDNRYLLSVPMGSATEPDSVWVYNTLAQSWTGVWQGLGATCWDVVQWSGEAERLVWGRADGVVRRNVESSAQDGGVAVVSEWWSRGMSFGQYANSKNGYQVKLVFYLSEADVAVGMRCDEGEWESLALGVSTYRDEPKLDMALDFKLEPSGTRDVVIPLLHRGAFESVQFKVRSEGNKLALRGVAVQAFLNTLDEGQGL